MQYTNSQTLLKAIVSACKAAEASGCNYRNKELIKKYQDYKNTGDTSILVLVLAKAVKGHVHQSRMKWGSVVKVILRILESGILLKAFNDFEKLYEAVKELVKDIEFARGILTRYDIAVNLGQLLETTVQPDKYLYLATHTSKTYKYIYGKKPKGICLKHSDVAGDFGGLSSVAIENLLCNFYSLFKKLDEENIVTDDDITNLVEKRMKRTVCIDWEFVKEKLAPFESEIMEFCNKN
ncbi:MAG: hypothetical protein IJ436_04430 [Bacteroidaceae bacterium]|nr:hypothetical protein [Bacteroidaceae bacterium]